MTAVERTTDSAALELRLYLAVCSCQENVRPGMHRPLEPLVLAEMCPLLQLVEFRVPRKSKIGQVDFDEVGIEILLFWREAERKTVGGRGQDLCQAWWGVTVRGPVREIMKTMHLGM